MAAKCASCGHEHDNWVPRDRLASVEAKVAAPLQERIRELEAAAEAAKGEAAQAAETLSASQAQIAELTGRAETLSQESAIIRAGVTDDEGVAMIRTLYAAVPDEQRPASLAEWLAAPDTLPRAVRVYLPTPAAPAPDAPAAPKAPEPAPAPAGTPAPKAASSVVPGEPPATAPKIDVNAMSLEELRQIAQTWRN